MKTDRISQRQLLVLLFTALLSPAVALTGRATCWPAALWMVPGALLLALVLGRLGDLPQAFRGTLGTAWGNVLIFLYLLWCQGLLVLYAKGGVARLVASGYEQTPKLLLGALLLGVIFHLARGRLCVFCRGVEIFYLVLVVFLGAVGLLSLSHLELSHLLVPVSSTLYIKEGLPGLGVVAVATLGGFLGGQITGRQGDGRRRLAWSASYSAVAVGLSAAVVGTLGPALAQKLPGPFFTMVQALGVEGAFQRVEGLAAALWVLADLALLGLVAFAGRSMAAALWGKMAGRRGVAVLLTVALAGSVLLSDGGAVALRGWAAAGNVAFGFAVPLLILLVGFLRGKAGGISCVPPGEKGKM